MVFSTPEVRDTYTNITLRGIVHLPSIDQLADAVASAMRELTKGRKWMAVHWRRGDCAYIFFFPFLSLSTLTHAWLIA